MSLRKYFKRLGRKTAKVSVQVNRVVVPVVSAAAGFVGGAPAAAAVTAIGAEGGRYFRATQARNEGQQSRARALGRGERKRIGIYGGIGGGAGMLGSGVYGLAMGNSVLQALGQTAFGQGGAQILGIGHSAFATPTQTALAAGIGPFGPLNPAITGTQLADLPAGPFVTAGNLGAQSSSSLPGLVTAGNIGAQPSTSVPGLVSAGNLASQPSTSVPGLVTAGNLASQPSSAVPGLITSLESSAATSGGGFLSDLGNAVSSTGVLSKILGNRIPPIEERQPNPQSPTQDFVDGLLAGLGFGGSGGGNGGDGDGKGGHISDSDSKGGLLPVLIIGGLLLAAK